MEALQEKKKSNPTPHGQRRGAFFAPVPVQTKLTVNKPGDIYEQEADTVAEQVLSRRSVANRDPDSKKSPFSSTLPKTIGSTSYSESNPLTISKPAASNFTSVQTKCDACEAEDKDKEEDKIQRKPESQITLQADSDDDEDESTIMAKHGLPSQPEVSHETASQLYSSKGSGDPLPKIAKSEMERGFGTDFSNVRIHTGPSATHMSKNLNAQAFTHGSDIYFNSGKFDTQSTGGKKLLAHELTHVVQQSQSETSKIQRSPWGPCPTGIPVDARKFFINKPAELAAIAHYKLTSSGVVVTNEELLIGHSLTGLPPREQKIFDDIKNGFHRGKSPQKRHKIEPPDSVTEALDPADAVGGKAIDLVQSLLEPDLINLTTREVFDVTTVKEQSKKLSKIRTIYLPFLKLATGLNWTEGTKMTPMIPYVIPILPSKNVVCFGGTDFARFPGVVAYDAMEFDIKKWKKPGGPDKPKEPDKPKAGGSAFNFGLGISILSSSSGAANAGIGVSIMSDGVSVGTLSAGVIYDSQGAAVAVVGAGASSGSTTAAAGAAGAGTSKDDLSAGAGVAGAGKSEGNAIAGAGVAGKGSMEGQVKTQAGKSGDTDSKKTGDGEGDGNDSTKEVISKATKLDEALIKATPAQKKLLAKMAGKQKGNYSIPDQKWMEEFLETTKNITDAEVDNLADMTTGNSKSDLDTIKKKSGEGSGKDGDKPSSPDSQKDKTGDGGTAGTDDKFKGFNDSNRKKLTEATKPVASLFKAFAQGQKDDLILNDDVVTKFFEIVPSDLTQEQADKLIDGMESSKGKTPDEVIENLRKAIAEVKKSTTTGATTSTTTSTPTTNTETPDQRIKRLQTQAGNWDFSKIPKGAGRVANLNDKIKDGTISTYVYYKLKNGIGTVTEIRATVPKDLNIDKLKRGSKINLTITYTSEFVDAKGNIHKINLGSTMTIEK